MKKEKMMIKLFEDFYDLEDLSDEDIFGKIKLEAGDIVELIHTEKCYCYSLGEKPLEKTNFDIGDKFIVKEVRDFPNQIYIRILKPEDANPAFGNRPYTQFWYNYDCFEKINK